MNPPVRSYRIDWWLPLESSPGEWAGRWEVAVSADRARTIALAVLKEQPAGGQVLLTLHGVTITSAERVVADARALQDWRTELTNLPESGLDPSQLPPLGREDVEHVTLVHCKAALTAAEKAELLDAASIAAILEIVQQACTGIGPAAEIAKIIRRETAS